MKNILKITGILALLAIAVINVGISLNFGDSSKSSISLLNLAMAEDGESGGGGECDVIVTPEGGGTQGAILVETICYSFPILEMEAECIWTGDCEYICMFDDEHDCES